MHLPADAEKAALERLQMLMRLRYYVRALAATITGFAAMIRAYRPFSIVTALFALLAWAALWASVGANDLGLVVTGLFTLLSSVVRGPYRGACLAVAGLGLLSWLALSVYEKVRRS